MSDQLGMDFRRAMRTLTSAVTVIATECRGRRFGMTATAVCSVAVDPPSLLVCVNRSASLHDPMLEAGNFSVNVLHANQSDIAETFSSKKLDNRFSVGDWHRGEDGIPYLLDAQASALCTLAAHHEHATHGIFIGHVRGVRVLTQINPLIYQDGRYTVGLCDGVDWVVPAA